MKEKYVLRELGMNEDTSNFLWLFFCCTVCRKSFVLFSVFHYYCYSMTKKSRPNLYVKYTKQFYRTYWTFCNRQRRVSGIKLSVHPPDATRGLHRRHDLRLAQRALLYQVPASLVDTKAITYTLLLAK